MKHKGPSTKVYLLRLNNEIITKKPQLTSGQSTVDFKKLSNSCGENILNGANNELTYVVNGQENCKVYVELHDGYIIKLKSKGPERDFIDSGKLAKLEADNTNLLGPGNFYVLGTKEIPTPNNQKETEIEIFTKSKLPEDKKNVPAEVAKERDNIIGLPIVDKVKSIDPNAYEMTVTPRQPIPASDDVAKPKLFLISGASVTPITPTPTTPTINNGDSISIGGA